LPNFQSTQPQGAPDLMRVSDFRRYLAEVVRDNGGDAAASRLSALSPSLMQDLMRFEQPGQHSEPLEVLAACIRHTQHLAIHLEFDGRVITLSVFPVDKLVHCPLPIVEFLAGPIGQLKVLQVEPAMLRPPGHTETARIGDDALYGPLGPVLWEMAMRGGRDDLLPEIGGQVAYRVAHGTNLQAREVSSVVAAAVRRMRKQTCNLREISEWPGMDRSRAMRLVNALYLQSALIISRTHPAATNEGWFGYGNR
jgi:hypothetical protein